MSMATSAPSPATRPSQYEVTSVDPATNEELFVEVRRAAMGEDATSGALHRWQYRRGPEGPNEALLLRALGGEPVGWISLQPRRLAVDGLIRRGGLLVNLVVTAEHRKVLPALMLQRRAAERAREVYDLSYGYPNHAALGGFLRARYATLGPILRYACPLTDHGRRLARLGMSPRLAQVAGVAADLTLPRARRAMWLRWRRRYAFEWLADVDERFDELWRRSVSASRGRVVGDRSADFISWRLVQHPRERHELGVLLDRRTDRLAGYAAVRHVGSRAQIGDFFAVDDAHAALFDGLLASLVRQGVDTAEVSYLGGQAVIAALTSRGFRAREEVRTVIVDPGRQSQPWLGEPERWHLTASDGDL